MRSHHSYLPLYYNSQEKQFLKEILGRKSHSIMIKGNWWSLSHLRGLCAKKSTAKSRYLFLQKAS